MSKKENVLERSIEERLTQARPQQVAPKPAKRQLFMVLMTGLLLLSFLIPIFQMIYHWAFGTPFRR